MSLACVVSTIAGSRDARDRSNPWSGGPSYASRAWVLRNVLLPWLTTVEPFEELVVTGEWEPGPGYRYVEVPEVCHNVGDLLLQRQAGFEATTGDAQDWVLYLNDDTLWDPMNLWPSPREACGVLSPSRWTRARDPHGERLNDGGGAYVMFHATLVRRDVTARVPWTNLLAIPGLDLAFTGALQHAGIPWRYAPEYKVWDLEQGAAPWR